MKGFGEDALRIKYEERLPKYKRLGRNLKQALETFLDDAGIDVVSVTYRVKDFNSFFEKIKRKNYKNPFQETEDICGVRIVSYYPSDLDKITQIINNEFDIQESIDKAELLEPDRFGYRSIHLILTVKKDWLKAPNYRGLSGLKAEVQVRTILMHAWADFEHKLAYKKTEHIPDQFRRKLYRLSAQFEELDEKFDSIRKEREEYLERILSEEVKKSGRFDVNQVMNLDSLQAFLDFYLPDRSRTPLATSTLLDEIMIIGIVFKDLVEGFEKTKDIVPLVEKEISTLNHYSGLRWVQVGALRCVLDLTNDRYWQIHGQKFDPDYVQIMKKWRAKLSE